MFREGGTFLKISLKWGEGTFFAIAKNVGEGGKRAV